MPGKKTFIHIYIYYISKVCRKGISLFVKLLNNDTLNKGAFRNADGQGVEQLGQIIFCLQKNLIFIRGLQIQPERNS